MSCAHPRRLGSHDDEADPNQVAYNLFTVGSSLAIEYKHNIARELINPDQVSTSMQAI